MAFYIGQKVVRIGGNVQEDGRGSPPPINAVFTVSWVGIDQGGAGSEEVIDLVELPRPENSKFWRGYKARFFRPLVERKTDIGFAHDILRKVTKRQGADA